MLLYLCIYYYSIISYLKYSKIFCTHAHQSKIQETYKTLRWPVALAIGLAQQFTPQLDRNNQLPILWISTRHFLDSLFRLLVLLSRRRGEWDKGTDGEEVVAVHCSSGAHDPRSLLHNRLPGGAHHYFKKGKQRNLDQVLFLLLRTRCFCFLTSIVKK